MEAAYTADDLLAAADKAGFPNLTARMVTDWVQKGLLDQPVRNPKGRGQGSAKGTYPESQRQLFLLLLDKRASSPHIALLVNVPIAIWSYWGEEYVPTRQVLRALTTWASQNETSSKARASGGVDGLIEQIAHPDANDTAIRGLRRTLLEAAIGRAGFDRNLSKRIADVADPHGQGMLGLPGIRLDPEKVVGAWVMQRRAIHALRNGSISHGELEQARELHRQDVAEYTLLQPLVAASAPIDPYNRVLANPLELQVLVNNAAKNLLLPLAATMNLGAR